MKAEQQELPPSPGDKPTLSSIPMNLVPLQELQAIAQDEDTRISLANASRSTGD